MNLSSDFENGGRDEELTPFQEWKISRHQFSPDTPAGNEHYDPLMADMMMTQERERRRMADGILEEDEDELNPHYISTTHSSGVSDVGNQELYMNILENNQNGGVLNG